MEGLERKTDEGQERNEGRLGGGVEKKGEKRDRDDI